MTITRYVILGTLARCGCAWVVDRTIGLDEQIVFCPDHVWYRQLPLPLEDHR